MEKKKEYLSKEEIERFLNDLSKDNIDMKIMIDNLRKEQSNECDNPEMEDDLNCVIERFMEAFKDNKELIDSFNSMLFIANNYESNYINLSHVYYFCLEQLSKLN